MQPSKEFASAWNIIINWVKQDEFFVNPEFKTIGGMWTQDRWERDGIIVLQSEADIVINAPAILSVSDGYAGVKFHKGGMDEMVRICGEIAIEKQRIADSGEPYKLGGPVPHSDWLRMHGMDNKSHKV